MKKKGKHKTRKVPAKDALQTGTTQCRDEAVSRITKVVRMLEDRHSLRVADSSASGAPLPVYVTLGVACLCLRLTMITTSITGQKVAGDDDERLPLLLRLAKGTVTARAGEELAGILTAVPDDPGLRNHGGGSSRDCLSRWVN